jgi:acyl-CoA synthetase (AMP-forming)/AMP-acid ligase II
MNLTSLLARRAALHPQRPALVDASSGTDRVLTYGELSRRVACGAGQLDRMGLRRGHTVLVFQPVSLELYEFLLASFHAGLRVMLADPSAGRAFLGQCCQRLRPDAFFGSWKAQCLRWIVPEMRSIPRAIGTGAYFPRVTSWRPNNTPLERTDVPDEEPALITFTSGSTGKPKAAVRTHGFLLAQHAALSKALDFEDGEVDLITLPVFVLANLASGLTSVLAATDLAKPGSPDTGAIHAQCSRHGVTRCAASPAFFEGFLSSPKGMPSLAKLYTGGAPVFPDLLQRLRRALPDSLIHAVYGSTEAEPIAHFDADTTDDGITHITTTGGGLCAGFPVPDISLRIIQDHWGTPLGPLDPGNFDSLTQATGAAGEIVVSGHHVLQGYLDGIGNEETKIRVGNQTWHRTGDAGWQDSSGRIWLLGRCAEKLPPHPAPAGLPAAALSYPFAIECAMRERFPATRMAALAWRGKRILVREPSAAPEADIRTHAATLGMNNILSISQLPLDRRHQAKIDYPALRSELEQVAD